MSTEPENKDDDDDAEGTLKIYESKKVATKYDVYLGSSFEGPDKYLKIFHLLDHAKKDDEFVFYLNSYGGRVDSGIQFASKLSKTKAHTKTVVEAPCYSMGAIFPFLTREVEMHPHTFLMWHDASGGSFGKMNEQELRICSFNKLFKEMLEVHCSKVLTSKEITDICKGRDLYLTNKEIEARLGKKANKGTKK